MQFLLYLLLVNACYIRALIWKLLRDRFRRQIITRPIVVIYARVALTFRPGTADRRGDGNIGSPS